MARLLNGGEVAQCLAGDSASNPAEEVPREAPRCCWVLWGPGIGEAALSLSLAGEGCVLQESIVVAALCTGGRHVAKLCLCRNLVLEKLCAVGTECWGRWLRRNLARQTCSE